MDKGDYQGPCKGLLQGPKINLEVKDYPIMPVTFV